MRVIKKLLEALKSKVPTLTNMAQLGTRADHLLRIEHKLDAIMHQLESLGGDSLMINSIKPVHTDYFCANQKDDQQVRPNLSDLLLNIEQKFENHFLQFEALLSIYNSLPNLKFLPATRGWAGSPDFLAKIIEIILKKKPRFILEASSGVSTLVIGLALKLNNYGKVLSLDHKEVYAEITKENILLNDACDFVDVMHCPLRGYVHSNQDWIWYESDTLNFAEKIDMLIIDGPPGSTQFLARYPAVPLLHHYFSDKTLIVLDDANRSDEIIIVKKWIDFLTENNFDTSVTEFKNFEKGMVILELSRRS